MKRGAKINVAEFVESEIKLLKEFQEGIEAQIKEGNEHDIKDTIDGDWMDMYLIWSEGKKYDD